MFIDSEGYLLSLCAVFIDGGTATGRVMYCAYTQRENVIERVTYCVHRERECYRESDVQCL